LAKIGKSFGFGARLEFLGLPTRATVAALMEDFRQGRRGMGDLAVAAMWRGGDLWISASPAVVSRIANISNYS
jgi:hypothetical protein